MIYCTKVLQMRKINLPHNAYLNSLQNHSLYRVLREIGKTTFRRKKEKKNPKPTQKKTPSLLKRIMNGISL